MSVGASNAVTDTPKGISVSLVHDEVLVRVVGRGTFQNSQPLRRYALEMIERGLRRFTIDLGACDGMDSTFLGVLAGMGLRLMQNGGAGQIRIANAGSRNVELLRTLGLDRLFGIDSAGAGKYEPPAEAVFERLPDSDLTQLGKPLAKAETADLMLEAHDNLVRADERNLAKFKDLTTFLREKIDKRSGEAHKKT
jgi:anti-sigma B factor antagonist